MSVRETLGETTILEFPPPHRTAFSDMVRYVELIQHEKTTMSRDAVEGLVPFLVGSVEQMYKEIRSLESQLAAARAQIKGEG